MSTCIKTGGMILLDDYDEAFSCDLHLVRDPRRNPLVLVAYTAGPGEREVPPHLILVRVWARADYFFRRMQDAHNTYGIIVVSPERCTPSHDLLDYIERDPLAKGIRWGGVPS